jgi:hypothetical protein
MTRQIRRGSSGVESLLVGTLAVAVGGGVDVWPWNDSNGLGQAVGAKSAAAPTTASGVTHGFGVEQSAVGAGALGAPTAVRTAHGSAVTTGDGVEQNPIAGLASETSTRQGVALGSRVAVGAAVGGSVTSTIGGSVTSTRVFGLVARAEPAKAVRTAARASSPLSARVVARRRTTFEVPPSLAEGETPPPHAGANIGGRSLNVQQIAYI